jgi:hypothetical protein
MLVRIALAAGASDHTEVGKRHAAAPDGREPGCGLPADCSQEQSDDTEEKPESHTGPGLPQPLLRTPTRWILHVALEPKPKELPSRLDARQSRCAFHADKAYSSKGLIAKGLSILAIVSL